MTCYSPLKGFENKTDGGIVFKRSNNAGKPMEVACGQCIGCRIDKSKEWAARIVHESQMHQENSFVTLTYDEEHLPEDGSLKKSDFQKFMKRLRKQTDQKIRYFHCGEYGAQLQRPHYHACIFNRDFPDRVPFSVTNDVVTYTSEELQKIWGLGFCTTGELNYETAAYTARYIMKKITGHRAEEHYTRLNPYTGELIQLQPEYVTMSLGRTKGHGIGGTFFEQYKTDFYPRDECPIPGKGVYKKIPKYYERIFEKEAPDTVATIKKTREAFKLRHAAEYTPRRLEDKYRVKKAQIKQLKRHEQ